MVVIMERPDMPIPLSNQDLFILIKLSNLKNGSTFVEIEHKKPVQHLAAPCFSCFPASSLLYPLIPVVAHPPHNFTCSLLAECFELLCVSRIFSTMFSRFSVK